MAFISIAAIIRLIEVLSRIPGKFPRRSAKKDALIAALIASIPILTKELIPVIIEAIRNLGRKHKTYYAADYDTCHIYDNCTVGTKIKAEHRHRGTGDKELCAECRDRLLER